MFVNWMAVSKHTSVLNCVVTPRMDGEHSGLIMYVCYRKIPARNVAAGKMSLSYNATIQCPPVETAIKIKGGSDDSTDTFTPRTGRLPVNHE